jgi:hypothetical protein
MDSEFIQALRYKLQRRVRRLNSTDYQLFHFSLKQFWGFLQKSIVILGIIEDLKARFPTQDKEVEPMFSEKHGDGGLLWSDEDEHTAASIFIIEKCVKSDNQMIEVNIGQKYSDASNYNEILESFKDNFLETAYDYIDEKLDDQRLLLGLLRKYKQKCEWFQRHHLYELCIQHTEIGEKILANHLYEFLHDQGIQFSIEPQSVSGEADLVSIQSGEDAIVADAKIFWPEKGKNISYLCKGFNQVYLYTTDYNEPFGYLVVFNMSGKDLRFSLENYSLNFPFVVHNAKTIYFITIDLFPYETSASKRGKAESYIISEADLRKEIEQNTKPQL